MKTKEDYSENIRNHMSIRVFNEIMDIRRNDKSYTGRSGIFGFGQKYNQSEVREIYLKAIEIGIEIGMMLGSYEEQMLNLKDNIQNEKHKEFYDKFMNLCKEYDCGIQYHPQKGMQFYGMSEYWKQRNAI